MGEGRGEGKAVVHDPHFAIVKVAGRPLGGRKDGHEGLGGHEAGGDKGKIGAGG